MSDEDQKKKGASSLAVSGAVVALATLAGNIYTTAQEDRHALTSRADKLSERLMEFQAESQALEIQLIALKSELMETVNRTDVISSYLDDMPLPAWIKTQRPDGKFEMMMINYAYEREFDKTKLQYQGATDYEVWGDEVAKGFEKNDLSVMKDKRKHCSIESIGDSFVKVCKFPIILGGSRIGVGGILIKL